MNDHIYVGALAVVLYATGHWIGGTVLAVWAMVLAYNYKP